MIYGKGFGATLIEVAFKQIGFYSHCNLDKTEPFNSNSLQLGSGIKFKFRRLSLIECGGRKLFSKLFLLPSGQIDSFSKP